MEIKNYENCLQLSLEAPLATVTLMRPEKHNGVTIDLMRGLIYAALQIKKNKSIRAVIIKGEGPSFSSGLDFSSVAKTPKLKIAHHSFKFFRRSNNGFQRCAMLWRDLPIPVIAVLHGNCFGAALQIALAADFRIAHPDTKLSIMEGRHGLIPDMTGMVTLPELTRIDQTKFLTMTASIIDAKQARDVGLVTEIADDPNQLALDWCEEFQKKSPDAIAATKKLFRKSWKSHSDTKTLFWETIYQIKLMTGKNFRIARQRAQGKNIPFKQRSFD
jgi:enoyl-CoA hydratase/carnithine racemase